MKMSFVKFSSKALLRLIVKSLFSLFVGLWASVLYADSITPPYPIVISSKFGSYYFTMIPERGRYVEGTYIISEPGYGVGYELLADGSSRELWRVTGWYAYNVYLSVDGKHLVRMGKWATGKEPSDENMAVAFYKNGKLLKKYSTDQLIVNKKNVHRTQSHYFWKADEKEFPKIEFQNRFFIKTIENRIYEFDASNGEIVNVKSVDCFFCFN